MQAIGHGKRSIWSSLVRALVAAFAIVFDLANLVAHQGRLREVSRDAAHSRERARLRSTIILADTVAPSRFGLVPVEEAWIEDVVSVRRGIRPLPTGSAYLVVRLRADYVGLHLLARGTDWPRDTLVLDVWFRAPRHVRVALRHDPQQFPDGGDTWEWDGAAWRRILARSGPRPT